jgi:hypothetical protein
MSSSETPEGPSRLLRAYAVTGGRTHVPGSAELEVEALVATTALGEARADTLSFERRAIARLCKDLLSVAEIAARIDVPLGVAKVLVADMAEEQLVVIHRPSRGLGDRPDLALLERVLYGLRSL